MKLLKPLPLLLLLFVSVCASAQDFILLKNGKVYKVKALKKSDDLIEFEKYESNRGRVYGLSAKKIFAYKYENGNITDVNGNLLTPTDFEYEKYTRLSHTKMKKGIELTSIGGGLMGAGASLLVYGVYHMTVYAAKNPRYDSNVMILPVILGAYLVAASVPLLIIGPINITKAKKAKQKANELKPNLSFNPFLTPMINTSGFRVGVSMGINF